MWMGHKRIFTYKCRCNAKNIITAVVQVMPLQRNLFSALPIFQAKFFHLPFCSNACSYILTEYDSGFMRNVVALIIQECTVPAVAALRRILAVF